MRWDASINRTASVSSASKILYIACIAASVPDFCPAHNCNEPLASTTSRLVMFITHFPQILLINSPTPIGLTAPSPLSRGMRRLATNGSMVEGSIYWVHRVFAMVAIASHSFVDDCLNDLQANIRLKPFASTPQGPQTLLFLRRLVWPFHHWSQSKLIQENSSSIGPNRSEPNLAGWGFGCFSCSCAMTSSVSGSTPPLVLSLRKRSAEFIWPSSTSLVNTFALSGGSIDLSFSYSTLDNPTFAQQLVDFPVFPLDKTFWQQLLVLFGFGLGD